MVTWTDNHDNTCATNFLSSLKWTLCLVMVIISMNLGRPGTSYYFTTVVSTELAHCMLIAYNTHNTNVTFTYPEVYFSRIMIWFNVRHLTWIVYQNIE